MELFFKKKLYNNYFNFLNLLPKISNNLYNHSRKSQEERIKIFCVGLPRSGTHSMAHLFSKNFRSSHEPLTAPTVHQLLDIKRRGYSGRKVEEFLLLRNKYLNLEVEAAHYLHIVIPYLIKLFEHSKFILTVREPFSWLNSEINMNLRTSGDGFWDKLQSYRYGKYNLDYEIEFLKNHKSLHPISSYLEYYKYHINYVIDNVPSNRLLMVDTFKISSSINEIAEFAEVDISSLDLAKKHMSKGRKKINIEDIIDRKILEDKIKYHCERLITDKLPFLKNNDSYT